MVRWSLEQLNPELIYNPPIPPLDRHPDEYGKRDSDRHLYTYVHNSVSTLTKRWKQPRWTLTEPSIHNMCPLHTLEYYCFRKEVHSDTCHTVDEPWRHQVKSVSHKGRVTSDSTSQRYLKWSSLGRQNMEWWLPGLGKERMGNHRLTVQGPGLRRGQVMEMHSGDECTARQAYFPPLKCMLKTGLGAGCSGLGTLSVLLANATEDRTQMHSIACKMSILQCLLFLLNEIISHHFSADTEHRH